MTSGCIGQVYFCLCSCCICGRLGSRNGCEATAGLSIAPTCAVMFVTSAAAIAKSRISLFTRNLESPVVPFIL